MDTITLPVLQQPLNATVTIPGSKSLTNRALLIAALANGETCLHNALFSDDTHWFSSCLQSLHIAVSSNANEATCCVTGTGGIIPAKEATLFVGNAGTAARFITAMLALGEGTYHMDGIPRMRERPMGEMLTLLQQLGTDIEFTEKTGYMPYTIHSYGFTGGTIRLKANETSQQLSALMMIAPYAHHDTTLKIDGKLVSRPYITMTQRVMHDFGVEVVQQDEDCFFIAAGQCYVPQKTYTIEPDASNASYFFAAAAVTGGRVRVNHLTPLSMQGDIAFLRVLAAMGCHITTHNNAVEVQGPAQLCGIEVDMNDISDTVQTLAAIAPFASSPVTIRHVEHIRWKETDRIMAVVTELRRLGVVVEEYPDGLTIQPGDVTPTDVNTYDDHRMAMAFAMMGLRVPGIIINNPHCTSKTFPDFFTRFLAMYT